MMNFLIDYSAELISTGTILIALIYPFAKRIIADKNLLEMFQVTKSTITENRDIKVNIIQNLDSFKKRISDMKDLQIEQTASFERIILEFQEGELYQKMLLSAEQVDLIHQTLKVKDDTIKILGTTIKGLTKDIQEIKNTLKG